MAIDIKIPSVGESIQEAVLAEWFKENGDVVKKDEPLLVIETDKVTLEVVAEADGVLTILIKAGETVVIGARVGEIEPLADAPRSKTPEKAPKEAAPAQRKSSVPAAADEKPAPPRSAESEAPETAAQRMHLPPSVRRQVLEKNLDVSRLAEDNLNEGIGMGDVLSYLERTSTGLPETTASSNQETASPAKDVQKDMQEVVRKPMSPIRKRIAQRLLESKQHTAMLTTFNEIDMHRAMAMRTRYKDVFQQKHDVSLGFMSFFIRACVEALKEIPEINAFIEGDALVYHNYQHIGVAIGSERGLVVPVIRYAEKMSFARIEQAIVDYVKKIKENRLELADLEGGTFTVSNGGVYGSLLSTPILNMPQSGILGMHKIEKRPVVIDDEIVIRPMMYVALSYDHRIVDGKGAVTFLRRVKDFIENPERILLEV